MQRKKYLIIGILNPKKLNNINYAKSQIIKNQQNI